MGRHEPRQSGAEARWRSRLLRQPQDSLQSTAFQYSCEVPLRLWEASQRGSLRSRLRKVIRRAYLQRAFSCACLALGGSPANLRKVGGSGPASNGSHAGHQRSPFCSGDYAARVHQVEELRALEAVIVSGKQRITNAFLPFHAFETVEKLLSLLLVQFKFRPDRGRVAAVEAVFGKLL